MIPFKNSLVFRIFLISFILLALPLLVDIFVIVQTRYAENLENAKEYLLKIPETRTYVLSRILQAKKQAMRFAVYFLQLDENIPEAQTPSFDTKIQELAKAGDFEDIILLKAMPGGKMKIVGSSFADAGAEGGFHSYAYYEKLTGLVDDLGQEQYSLLYVSPDNKNLLLFGEIIRERNSHQVLGQLIFIVDITKRLQEFLATSHANLEMHYALLLNNLMVIADPEDQSFIFSHFFPLSPQTIARQKEVHLPGIPFIDAKPLQGINYEMGPPFIGFEWKGKKMVGLIQPIAETEFYLLAFTPQDLLYINPFINFFSLYALFGVILLIGGQLAFLSSRRISLPFRKLSEVMEGIQKGDLDKRYIHDPLGFEINTLGHSFNEMVEALLEKKYLAEEEKVKVQIVERELRIGQQVQRGLFPTQIPTYHGIEVAERYIPAKEVGGDFYDVFSRKMNGKEQMTLVIADASGKGVQACFYSLGVRSNLRVFAREFEDTATIMKYVNRLFYYDSGDTGMFVTVLIGIYDAQTKEFEFCSCGHNPPLLRKKNGQMEFLGGVSMAFGVQKEIEPKSYRVKLESGDLIVFYTDGVTEDHDEKNNLFSEERLVEFTKERGEQNVEEIAEELIMELRKFQGAAPQHDDITLLLMKVL